MKLLTYNIYFVQNDTNIERQISLQEFEEVAGETLSEMLGIASLMVKKYAIRREGEHEVLHLWCAYREDAALCTNCGSVTTKANPIETISIKHSDMWGKETFLHFLSRRFECEQCGSSFNGDLPIRT
jgi:transposase